MNYKVYNDGDTNFKYATFGQIKATLMPKELERFEAWMRVELHPCYLLAGDAAIQQRTYEKFLRMEAI